MNCILFRPHALLSSTFRYKATHSRTTFKPHFASVFINEKRYYAKGKGDVEFSVPEVGDDPFDLSATPPPSSEKLSPKFVQRLKKQKRLEQMSRRSMKEERLTMPHVATPKILSNLFGVRTIDIFKVMIKLDLDPKTPDDTIDQNLADIMAEEFYFVPVRRELYDEFRPNKSTSDIRPRSPIVTVMGHVDHGKTTLLDALRNSSRASAEAGGITQHISAFEVEIGESKATFIDTPGHEAFHEMRARGSSVADIVVLVISSDDGVQNQTMEILERLESSRIPFIVAITKIDKETAYPERVYKQLQERGHKVEQLGGDLQCVHVSARTGLGLSELVDAINLQSEYLGVSCDHSGRGEGTVLEAKKDRGRGYTATIIIRSGIMKLGASFVSGNMKGKIRSISDGAGRSLTSAGPSKVIEVSGFKDVVPAPGSDFVIVENEAQAHQLLEFRLQKKNLEEKVLEEMKIIEQDRAKNEIISRALEEDDTSILDSLIADDKKKKTENNIKQVNFVLKVDVPGSIAALTEAIKVIPCAEHNIEVQLAYSGVGDVTESDIARAKATKSSLICFNVSCPAHISLFARTEGVALYESKVIYNVIGHIAQTVEALLPPKIVSDPVGKATVKKVFRLHNRERSQVAGCVVDSGLVARKHRVRLLRGEEVLVDGKLESLRNVKEDVKEIKGGMECGMRISGWNDYQEGDIIECYSPRSVPTRLNFKQAQRRPSAL